MRTKHCSHCEGSGTVPDVTPSELRKARLKAGLSQAKIGAALGGIDTSAVSTIETGKRAITAKQARLWLAACGE